MASIIRLTPLPLLAFDCIKALSRLKAIPLFPLAMTKAPVGLGSNRLRAVKRKTGQPCVVSVRRSRFRSKVLLRQNRSLGRAVIMVLIL